MSEYIRRGPMASHSPMSVEHAVQCILDNATDPDSGDNSKDLRARVDKLAEIVAVLLRKECSNDERNVADVLTEVDYCAWEPYTGR